MSQVGLHRRTRGTLGQPPLFKKSRQQPPRHRRGDDEVPERNKEHATRTTTRCVTRDPTSRAAMDQAQITPDPVPPPSPGPCTTIVGHRDANSPVCTPRHITSSAEHHGPPTPRPAASGHSRTRPLLPSTFGGMGAATATNEGASTGQPRPRWVARGGDEEPPGSRERPMRLDRIGEILGRCLLASCAQVFWGAHLE
jgi:hypothetical protein